MTEHERKILDLLNNTIKELEVDPDKLTDEYLCGQWHMAMCLREEIDAIIVDDENRLSQE